MALCRVHRGFTYLVPAAVKASLKQLSEPPSQPSWGSEGGYERLATPFQDSSIVQCLGLHGQGRCDRVEPGMFQGF